MTYQCFADAPENSLSFNVRPLQGDQSLISSAKVLGDFGQFLKIKEEASTLWLHSSPVRNMY
jgi:hypothetical protein